MIGGLELAPETLFARALGTPSLVYLGRISYGTYLWHWPVIIVLARLVEMGPMATAAAAVAIGTAFGSISYQLVEMPVRRSPILDRHPKLVIAVGLSLSLVTGLVVAPAILRSRRPTVISRQIAASVPAPGAVSEPVPAGIGWEFARVDTPVEPVCLNRPARECVLVRGKGLHLHLVGDSHAKTLLSLFTALARNRGYTFSATVTGACPWQRGLVYIDNEERTRRCLAMQPDWYDRVIPALNPDIVIMFNDGYDDPNFPRPVRYASDAEGIGEQSDAIRRTAIRTVEALLRDGRRVVLLEPLPKSESIDPTVCLSGATMTNECNFESSVGAKPTETIDRFLDLQSPNVFSIDIDRVACPQYPTCVPVIDGLVVRRDRHHLTATFAQSRAMAVAALLEAAGALAAR